MNKTFLVYVSTPEKPWEFETDEAEYAKLYHAIRSALPEARLDIAVAPEEYQPTIVEGSIEA